MHNRDELLLLPRVVVDRRDAVRYGRGLVGRSKLRDRDLLGDVAGSFRRMGLSNLLAQRLLTGAGRSSVKAGKSSCPATTNLPEVGNRAKARKQSLGAVRAALSSARRGTAAESKEAGRMEQIVCIALSAGAVWSCVKACQPLNGLNVKGRKEG